MGCCNQVTTGTVAGDPDPSLHVNYVKGMVLGVDDYRQDFAYLCNGYRWVVRELIGYGTASGLAVTVEDDADGPRVRVTPGAAAPPSGKMICIGAAQCGSINDWLAKPDVADEVTRLLSGGSPPDEGVLNVHLTLCFRDCETLPVPVPGTPCRTDDELMVPSRIASGQAASSSSGGEEGSVSSTLSIQAASIAMASASAWAGGSKRNESE